MIKKSIKIIVAFIIQTLVVSFIIIYVFANTMEVYENYLEHQSIKKVHAIEIGMSKAEVTRIMGDPLFDDKNNNQFSYAYNLTDYEYIYIYFDSKGRVKEIVNPMQKD
jgi:outer membrane protein assembly factor BamE (lipoprotein component of BamABCDE complex)